MSKTVISIEHVTKEYRLGVLNSGSLRRDLSSWWAAIRGREDPNSVVTRASSSESQTDANRDLKERLRQRFLALSDVSFEVKQGDAVGIIGANGAGKSTLLKCISRITVPTKGTVKIRGTVSSLLEVGTGFHIELTGRENIFLNGAILGMRRSEIKAKIDEIIAFSELEKFIDTPVKRYSSGMNVRLAFAVAAHLNADALLLDEVFAVGDVNFQKKCLGKMDEIARKQGRTVLFVSHQMNAIEKLCNCGIVLDRGVKMFESSNIRDVVKFYLSGGTGTVEKSTRWDNTKNIHSTPFFHLTSFYLSDGRGKQLRLPVSADEDIVVNVECDIHIIDAALSIGYSVVDDDGHIVYQSNQTDCREEEWPKLRVGHNHVRTRIPKRFLNEGDYRLFFEACINMVRWIIPPDSDNINIYFTVKGGLSDSPYWTERRPGILSPVLRWELVDN